MNKLFLKDLASILKGTLVRASHQVRTTAISNISIDTRTLQHGELFFAIKGDNFDGHDFVAAAKERGALAAVVSKALPIELPQLIVPDTIAALGQLGAWRRQQFKQKIIAVTGSCGKTTTKELLVSILRAFVGEDAVLGAIKSFNNALGLPLMMWNLNSKHQYAVFEMGANAPGEISYLTNLLHPHVAVITNAAPCHLEGFGSLDGVARAKGEIFEGLDEFRGIAVLNSDDQYFSYWRSLVANKRQITFGFNTVADISARDIKVDITGTRFTLRAAREEAEVHLPLMGEHNVANALAAVAATIAIDIPFADIVRGLQSTTAVKQRMKILSGRNHATIIDDSYNANPVALEAALRCLQQISGRKILVFGDMLEMGKETILWHEHVGRMACDFNVDALYAYGDYANYVVKSFDANNKCSGKIAQAFSSKEDLLAALQTELKPHATILVKGSRGNSLEVIVAGLIN